MFMIARTILSLLLTAGPGRLSTHGNAMGAVIKRGVSTKVGIDTEPIGWDPHTSSVQSLWQRADLRKPILIQQKNGNRAFTAKFLGTAGKAVFNRSFFLVHLDILKSFK
jgi:hypothetical protein